VGVNRVGTDIKGLNYSGDSSVFGPLGEMLWQESNKAVVQTVTLEKDVLLKTREQLPFLNDADKFVIVD
jgi:predicted amidohydrolase